MIHFIDYQNGYCFLKYKKNINRKNYQTQSKQIKLLKKKLQ